MKMKMMSDEEIENLVAIGYTSDGKHVIFDITHHSEEWIIVNAENKKLISIDIPEGVTYVVCDNNFITKLDLPSSVTFLFCDKKVKGLEKYIDKNDIMIFII